MVEMAENKKAQSPSRRERWIAMSECIYLRANIRYLRIYSEQETNRINLREQQ